jgi:MFS family permease
VANTASQALLIQTINGLTFPAMWMAGVAFVGEHAPPGLSATAQGILSAIVFGVGTSLGGFLGGNLLGIVGAKEMYLIFGIITTLIVASISLLAKQHPELFLS